MFLTNKVQIFQAPDVPRRSNMLAMTEEGGEINLYNTLYLKVPLTGD